MKPYLLLLVILLQVTTGRGQNSPQTFTLDQCVNYALENNISLKNSAVDEKIADGKVKETRGIGLPQIDVNVGLRHNQKLPRFFATKQTSFAFSGLPPEEYQNFLPGLADDDVVAAPNFFQLKSSGDAGLTVNQLIFNSSYLVGLQAANAYRDLAIKSTQQTKEEVIQQVSKAYYTCLINKDRVGLFESNIGRVDSLMRNTKALFENGLAESIDVDRVQVTLNNLIVERNKFMKLQEVAYQLLKFQMNYPMNQEIDVAGDISSIQIDENVLNEYSLNWDYAQRSDYQLLESNRRLQNLNVKNKYAESLPSLSAFANLGYATQSQNIGGLFVTNSDIPSTAQLGPDKWYSYSNFGINLNVPLFSGLQRTYRIQQAKLDLMKIENNFQQLKSAIDLEIKQSVSNYLNAMETARAQESNRELASNVARITKIKYEEGVGSSFEVVQAESDLREAQINYYNALYEAIVAKIDLDKAYGKLSGISQNVK
jgi:outer membrane protein